VIQLILRNQHAGGFHHHRRRGSGIGYAWSLLSGATATRCVLKDDFAPLLLDEDALDHERLWRKLYKRLQSVGRHGLVTQAQAAVDIPIVMGETISPAVPRLFGGCRAPGQNRVLSQAPF
jgi:hypothetical protein